MMPDPERTSINLGIFDDALSRPTEENAMSKSAEDPRDRKRRSKRRRHRHGIKPWRFEPLRPPEPPPCPFAQGDGADLDDRDYQGRDYRDPDYDDPSLLSPEERADREIRRRAEEKAEVYLDSGKAALVVLLLLFVIPPVGFVGLVWWAWGHGRRLFAVRFEPGIRERLIEDEVSRHVNSTVDSERRELADEHSRSLEVLSASIAHEIRNPITAAKSLLQQMREDPDANDNPEYAQVALAELERVERSISHLLRFGRDEEVTTKRIRMADVLDSALETFRERAEREGIEITRDFDCEGTLLGDAEKLRRVAINLIGNAMDALVDARVPNPRVEVSLGENLAGNEVWVRIRDNGEGIDDDTRARLFTPFFTAKEGGTGLGLAITKKLVEVHGGSIEVGSRPGSGAEFLLSFPKSEGETEPPRRRGVKR